MLKPGLADANADKTRTRRTRHMFLGRGRGRVRACYEPEKDADAVIFDRVPASLCFCCFRLAIKESVDAILFLKTNKCVWLKV